MTLMLKIFETCLQPTVITVFLVPLLLPPLVSSSAPFVPQCVSVSRPVVGACVPRSAAVLAVVFSGLQSAPYWPTADAGSPASGSTHQGCL